MQQKEELKMFEEYQEASQKLEQKKKTLNVIHIITGIIFSVMIVLITQYVI